MKLFQYAIFYVPAEKEGKKQSEKPVIVKDVTSILAKDERQALIKINREIPEQYLEKLDEVQVVIRPF